MSRKTPTNKQKIAFDNLVGNGGNVTKAMIDANYSIATANTPQKLTESKGFKLLCKVAGLTDEFLTNALVEDIKKKPQNRKAELELGFKVTGRLKEADNSQKTLILVLSGESAQRYNVKPTQFTEDSSA